MFQALRGVIENASQFQVLVNYTVQDEFGHQFSAQSRVNVPDTSSLNLTDEEAIVLIETTINDQYTLDSEALVRHYNRVYGAIARLSENP